MDAGPTADTGTRPWLLDHDNSRMTVEQANPLADCSDEVLLAHFKRGQREAFGLLVRRYERELYGYLCRYLGDANLAEDVFQNTFLQLYTKIGTYEQGRPVRPWLYTIATHQAIDALRRVGRRQTLSLDQQREETANGDVQTLLSLLESRWSSPLEQVQAEERRQWVRESVDRLPDFLRQVVVLAYYQGLKYREIAQMLNIPLGTVKSRLHAALVRLQETWHAATSMQE
jgi:RNA polymerase sigma-70 factor (ECF subfamily)